MAQIPRLELPSGGWVEFGDPNELVKGRHTRIVLSAIGDEYTPGSQANATAVLAPVVVSRWSFPVEPTIEAIDDLSNPDFMALYNHLGPAIGAVVGGKPYEPKPKPEEEVAGEGDAPGTE